MINTIATVELHFLGQQGFAWWGLVALATGLALGAYSWMQIRSAATSSAAPEGPRRPWTAMIAAGVAIIYGLMVLIVPTARVISVAILFTIVIMGLAIWLFYQRVYQVLGRRRILTLLSLRLAGMAFILLLMFQPVLAWITVPQRMATLGIMIDASGSMSVNDRPNEPSRYLLSVQAAHMLIHDLHNHLAIRCFAYDGIHNGPLTGPAQWNAIAPDGKETDLPTAIKMAADAGVQQLVLFSDGIQNGPTKLSTLAKIPVRVYPVRVGSTSTHAKGVPQIEIVRVNGPQTAPVDTQIALTALVRSSAFNDRTIHIYLMAGKKQLDTHRLVLHSGPAPQTVRFQFTPQKVGRLVLTVRIPVDPAERSTAGNKQHFPMLITNPKIPVLYLEGRIRPEVGPLEQDLSTDPNVNLVSLIQTRPGYFMVRGANKHLTALPDTLAQWKEFKVIILGDVRSSFLTRTQQNELKDVIRAGAGFLMIGGQHNFASGDWGESDLAAAFPIQLQPVQPAQLNTPFVPELTAFGLRNPIFQGISTWFGPPGGGAAKQQLPQLAGCVAFAGAKAGATVLLTDPEAQVNGHPAIVLAVQHYGQGRAAAFAADTTYRWQLALRTMGRRSPYHRFWGQLIRWLAGESKVKTAQGPSVTAMIRREHYDTGRQVRLRVEVTDTRGQLTRYAHVSAAMTGPDGKTRIFSMHARYSNIGMYTRNFMPPTAGLYQVVFTALRHGKILGSDHTEFSVIAPIGEMDKLAAEPRILQRIASITRGSYSELSGINALARRLQASIIAQNQAQRTAFPLYNNGLFFLLFVAALTVEWFLRRKWQLQ
ncbi:MAG: glutamine amidotransferase [Phycisphaerae bacterium]